MLDQAFEALKTYDWGTPLATVTPIEDAVAAAKDPSGRQQIEDRLIAALKGKLSRDARDYVCRKLAIIGSAASVPMLAILLTKSDSSHMARFALERITAPEAATALRDALPKVSGDLRIGVINSLGARRDAASVTSLQVWLDDGKSATGRATALALGAIGTEQAALVLQKTIEIVSMTSSPGMLVDGLLSCAESLLARQKVSEATAIYTKLNSPELPRLVRLAATRGLLACAGQQA